MVRVFPRPRIHSRSILGWFGLEVVKVEVGERKKTQEFPGVVQEGDDTLVVAGRTVTSNLRLEL
jgi:hypothetical protein